MWWALNNHPYLTPDVKSPRTILISSLTNQVQRDVIQPKLKEFLPEGRIKRAVIRQAGVLDLIEIDNGNTVLFRTVEQGREKYQGLSASALWMDEEHPFDIFGEAKTRLADQNGYLWCTMTPLKGMTWTFDEIYANPRAWLYGTNPAATGRQNVHIFKASIGDNPLISKDAIEEIMRSTPDEGIRNARLHGDFTTQVGRIYQEWTPKTHIIPNDTIEKVTLTAAQAKPIFKAIVGIDTGRCFSAAFTIIDRWGNHILFDEYYNEGGIIKDHSRIILAKCMEYDIRPMFFIDPTSQFKLELADYGIITYDGSDDVLDGIDRLRSLMKIAKGKETGLRHNNPSFYVMERCLRFRWEIERYIWDEWKGAAKYEKNAKARPRKKDDHMLDACRYTISAREKPQYEPERKIETNQLSRTHEQMLRMFATRKAQESRIIDIEDIFNIQ